MNWCRTHPRYEAKREPNSICGDCWSLFFYKNPELKHDAKRLLADAVEDCIDRERELKVRQ